ncbi:MAG: DUF3465 domain-containing protein [Microcystaceae cyanobacterium]
MNKKLLSKVCLSLTAIAVIYNVFSAIPVFSLPLNQAIIAQTNSVETLRKAFQNRTSNLQIQGQGKVLKILSDDNQGDKHQRFLLQLSSGQSLLIAHNIDLAPRVPNLKVGDTVVFYGEYEWNSKGGVIHWTHHDPQGRHPNGWLKHRGKTYQ